MKRYKGQNNPNKKWVLNEYLGNKFEDFIANVIKKQLKNQHPSTSVTQTVRSGDGGKDIIIESKNDILKTLGQTFISNNGNGLKIYIECKSTDDNLLRYNRITSSTTRIKYTNIDYYVLVTNSEIMPNTYWYIMEDFKSIGSSIKFVLVDSYLLGKYLLEEGYNNHLNNPYSIDDEASFYYEYQIETLHAINQHDIYFVFRNYNNYDMFCNLHLKTDVDWEMAEEQSEFIIPALSSITKKVTIVQNHFDGISDLLFQLEINGTESDIIIKGISGKQIFEPSFFGDERKEIIDEVSSDLKCAYSSTIYCFWGEAGIGKSRLVKEIVSNLLGTDLDIFKCNMNKCKNPTEDIKNFLITRGYVINHDDLCLSSLVANCKHLFDHSALIIIDDFHKASNHIIEEVKKIYKLKSPVSFIICGRTDYTVGGLDYMAFIQWTRDNIPKHSYEIEPLSDTDTKRMIQTLIDGIPQYALNRLFDLSMKNPLFIVQYIEYLLDCSLVRLINRNTVGIVDVNVFHSKSFIPNGISEIYKLRLKNLRKLDNGNNYIRLLYKISLYNINLSKQLFYRAFDDQYDSLKVLLKRRLLQLDDDGNINFIHESLYLYIKNEIKTKKTTIKELSKELLNSTEICSTLNDYQVGHLYLNITEYKKAEEQFKPIISWVNNSDNISNININFEYYEYLYDVFYTLMHKNNSLFLAKKSLLLRIYITLHHLIPINAANECDEILRILEKEKLSDIKTNLSILELKAHALMNAGLYNDGETILNEIQVQWISNNELVDNETLFDLFDRLASVYRHFNLGTLAKKYNELSRKLANELNNRNLMMLANRTKYKIYLYNNKDLASESLTETTKLNTLSPADRINTDNELDYCGFQLLYGDPNSLDYLETNLRKVLFHAEEMNYNRAQIHGFFLFAVCKLLKGDKQSLLLADEYVNKGINLSISYGINAYFWRLYNLYAIISIRLNKDEEIIYRQFSTVFDILEKRGLLYIGNKSLTHGNILALSNYGFYLSDKEFESLFYNKMSLVSYYDKKSTSIRREKDSVINSFLVKQYQLARDKKVLFVDTQPEQLLRDKSTDYIIVV